MKLLIVGDHGVLARSFIATVRKADWEVYLLVGKTGRAKKPPKVFEQYLFPYDSDSIREVILSVSPDVVLFMGLYDASFDWSNLQKTSMLYMSGLLNVLSATSELPGAQFVYLSSQEVFSDAQGLVDESVDPDPVSERGLLLAHGEDMTFRHAQLTGLNATVIRLDHPFGLLENNTEFRTIFEALCIDACQTHKLTVRSDSEFSGLYVADAVEGIYRIMVARDREHRLYHLSYGRTITEHWLADKIAQLSERNVEVELSLDEEAAENGCCGLLCERARTEFGFVARNGYSEVLPQVFRHTQRNLRHIAPEPPSTRSLRKERRRRWWKRLWKATWPFLLNAAGGVGAFLLHRFLMGGGYNERVDVLLLYPLLFAGIFGKRQAIFASALSVVYAFVHAENLFEMMINYNTYIWVAEVFIVSMLVGHLRDQLELVEVESDEEFAHLTGQLTEMRQINESNKSVKRAYEKRLIEYNGSLGRIYKMTSDLNKLQPGEVLFTAASAVAELMDTKDVAIYQVASDRYCRLFSATSPRARSLGRSVVYPELAGVGEALRDHRVYLNKKLDMSLPLMCNGIYDGDKLTYIIMIWGLKLENVSLYQANQLTILSYLIMLSVNRADQYLNALTNERFIHGTRIMETAAFREMLSLYTSAKRRHLVEFCLLRVELDAQSVTDADALLRTKTRNTDLIGHADGDALYILLPNSTPADAQVVIDRINGGGLRCTLTETEA